MRLHVAYYFVDTGNQIVIGKESQNTDNQSGYSRNHCGVDSTCQIADIDIITSIRQLEKSLNHTSNRSKESQHRASTSDSSQ